MVYTADREGRLTSATFYLSNKTIKETQITLSYEAETPQKPRWFNKEDPFQSDGATYVSVTYDLGNDKSYTLSQTSSGMQLSAVGTKSDRTILLPNNLPENLTVVLGSVAYVDALVFPQWSDELKLGKSATSRANIFFVKGTRPEGNLSDEVFFEGEWEWVDGVPEALKKR